MQHFGGSLAMHEQGERKERKHLVAVSPFPPYSSSAEREKQKRKGEKVFPVVQRPETESEGQTKEGLLPLLVVSHPFLFFLFCGLNSWSVFGWDVSYPPFPPGSDSTDRETRRKRKHFFCGGRGEMVCCVFSLPFPCPIGKYIVVDASSGMEITLVCFAGGE